MASAPEPSGRLNIRLDPAHKILIERAAAALGVTLTDFVVASLVRGAQRALDDSVLTRLNAEESSTFVKLLASPPEPVAALREAARRYIARHGASAVASESPARERRGSARQRRKAPRG